MEKIEITTEQIAINYVSALDSVNLIKELRAKETLTEDEEKTIQRNVEHLEIMLAKDYWTTEDLTPFEIK
jgi:chemotaxis regulatin CheY-phosphate phosphatase CheZ